MVDELQQENLETVSKEPTSEVVEAEKPAETQSETSSEVTEEKKANPYDDPSFRGEAEKIRESTRHKVSKKYEAEVAELRSKVEQLSSPPDDQSVYDQMLGDWRAKDISVEQYQELLQQKQQETSAAKQQQEWYQPMEERAEKLIKTKPDFQSTMTNAVQKGVVTQNMVLTAAQEDGGLELLYDLVKEDSAKLGELKKLPAMQQMKELLKLNWASSQKAPDKGTKADEPVAPETTVDSGNKDYASMNYRDGYQEYLNKKSRGRG